METALGRNLHDDEVEIRVDGEAEERAGGDEDVEEDKPSTFDEWVAQTCGGMKHLPESMDGDDGTWMLIDTTRGKECCSLCLFAVAPGGI